MPRDGSGNYTVPYPNFIAGATILDTEVDSNNSDIASALTASLAKDGQTTPTANLPMGGYKHTGVAASANRTDYVRVTELQDRTHDWPTVGGTADVITLTYSPTSVTAYAAGQKIRFKASGANTTTVTVNRDSLGAKAIKTATGAGLAAADITIGAIVEATYDGTDFIMTKAPAASTAIDIVGMTAETTPAAADVVPIYDDSATANRKMTLPNFFKAITALTAETAPAVADELPIYDASATAARKMTLANVLNVTTSLTALTAPAVDDELLIYDTSATEAKKITTVDLLETVNVLTEDTSPDGAADFLLAYDTSASTVKKVKPNNLSLGGITELASGSLSGTSVSFTSIPATYSYLVLQITGLSFSGSGAPDVHLSTNNGSSYDSTASNYVGSTIQAATAADLAEANLILTSGTAASNTHTFTVTLHAYQAGPYTQFVGTYQQSNGDVTTTTGMYLSASAVDALRVSGGTFDAGTYALYGVR